MRIFQNIRGFMTRHTAVFSAFSLLLIFSVCSALYTVNFLNNIIRNNEQSLEDERTYILAVNDAELDVKLKRLLSENEALSHVYCVINNGGEAVIADYYGHRYGREGVSYGEAFSESDLTEGAEKVILPNYPYLLSSGLLDEAHTRYNIGDSYEIGGVEYKAVGIGLLSEFAYQIPYNSISDKSSVSNIAVATKSTGDTAEIEEFSKYLGELFGGDVIKQPEPSESSSESWKYSVEVLLIIGIMSMSIFNLAYMYIYILDTRKKEIAVNRISGQTVFSAVFTAGGEVLIISTAGYLISVIFMKIILFPLLRNEGFLFADSIDAFQYFVIYIMFMLIYAAVFLPAIVYQVKKPPKEALSDV